MAHVPPLGLRRGERGHPRVVDVQVRHIADVAVVPSRSRLLGRVPVEEVEHRDRLVDLTQVEAGAHVLGVVGLDQPAHAGERLPQVHRDGDARAQGAVRVAPGVGERRAPQRDQLAREEVGELGAQRVPRRRRRPERRLGREHGRDEALHERGGQLVGGHDPALPEDRQGGRREVGDRPTADGVGPVQRLRALSSQHPCSFLSSSSTLRPRCAQKFAKSAHNPRATSPPRRETAVRPPVRAPPGAETPGWKAPETAREAHRTGPTGASAGQADRGRPPGGPSIAARRSCSISSL